MLTSSWRSREKNRDLIILFKIIYLENYRDLIILFNYFIYINIYLWIICKIYIFSALKIFINRETIKIIDNNNNNNMEGIKKLQNRNLL